MTMNTFYLFSQNCDDIVYFKYFFYHKKYDKNIMSNKISIRVLVFMLSEG